MADPASLPDTLARMTAFVSAQESMIDALSDWASGSATGGPAGDGAYPLQVRGGPSVTLPGPARIRQDANTPRLLILRAGEYRPTLDQCNAILRCEQGNDAMLWLPRIAPLGTTLVVIQWGTGKITLAGYDWGHTVKPGGASATAGKGSRATAIVIDVEAAGDAVWLVEGDGI